MKLRIGILAILGVAVVTALAIGAMAGLILEAHSDALLAQLRQGAGQLSETIGSSTFYDMLENRRPALRREIETIGRQKGIEKIRLVNRVGRIKFSSDSGEIGRGFTESSGPCLACHQGAEPLDRLPEKAEVRVFRAEDGHRVLGVIRPIHNEARCWNAGCHAHKRTERILGVLDVNLSLEEADRRIAADRRQLILLALLAIAASSLLLWWLNERLVVRPVATLIAGTRRVAEGDLHFTLPATASHELGDLARSFNDMTRRLGEAQRQLTQADKLASVGRLAAGVAHEINNPLTGVLTYASFLQKRLQDRPDMAQDLEVIVRETKRCRDIVRGLLDFSRQTPPQHQPTDLNEVVRRGVAVIMNQLVLKRVALDFALTEPLAPVPADANQIQQVVVNLVMNAADAIGEDGGTIHVRTAEVEVPWRGHTIIRTATCPKGCALPDAGTRIGRYPGIKVIRRQHDRDNVVHLDPVYGRVNHRASESVETGTISTYACPRCRTKLDLPEHKCPDCGAGTFAVHAGDFGRIEWCSRSGCHWTRCETLDKQGPQPYAELEVRDTGKGMSPDDLDHLFEPFFTTKGNRGLGLGLAVTWGIVEGHGGSIDVTSEPGCGASFVVRLPHRAPAPRGAEPSRGAS